MARIDLGRLTEEEMLELVLEAVPLLIEEDQWKVLNRLAEDLGPDSIKAELAELDKEDS